MDMMRKKYPNHTDIAYREAVSKLKYYLSESYAPKVTLTKPMALTKRLVNNKENVVAPQMYDEYDADGQSVISEFSKKEASTRKYYCAPPSRLSLPPNEMPAFIGRQDEYIEQLEKELGYCKEQLTQLAERVREVVAENQALQARLKNDFVRRVLDGAETSAKLDQPQEERRLEGPNIVFESRISELEAQLTQARLELRKCREEGLLLRVSERSEPQLLQQELERASREKRELEAQLQRELAKHRSRDTDVQLRSKRAVEVVQQAELDKAHAQAEARRLKDELREALQETKRRLLEEKQLMERRYGQQVEQLSADMASHWEAASDRQKREIAELRRELGQKAACVEEARKELRAKSAQLQEELSAAVAEKEAAQEELERGERQARQEQSRLQTELSSCKQRAERADADLAHARRESLRLAEQVAALEKEINVNKIVEETRVGAAVSRPAGIKFDRSSRDDKDKEKELASLIFDLENKQAKTVASLEESLSRQSELVSRLTEECQSLTRRLEANDQKHKKEMADLQSNVEYLSSKIRENLALRGQSLEQLAQTTQPPPYDNSEKSVEIVEEDIIDGGNGEQMDKYNLKLHSARQSFENQPEEQVNEDRRRDDDVVDDVDYSMQQQVDQNYPTDQQLLESDYQDYSQYNQYDPAEYADYYAEQQQQQQQQQEAQELYAEQEAQDYARQELYAQNNNNEQYQMSSEPYSDPKDNYNKDETFGEEINYNNYSNK